MIDGNNILKGKSSWRNLGTTFYQLSWF